MKAIRIITTFFFLALDYVWLDFYSKSTVNVFTIVRFKNDPCQGSSNRNGTCYTESECSDRGGSNAGSCAQVLRNIYEHLFRAWLNMWILFFYFHIFCKSSLFNFRVSVFAAHVSIVMLAKYSMKIWFTSLIKNPQASSENEKIFILIKIPIFWTFKVSKLEFIFIATKNDFWKCIVWKHGTKLKIYYNPFKFQWQQFLRLLNDHSGQVQF